MMLSVIALAVVLVAGGTMAWFTDEAGPVINTFEAGTVEIELCDKTISYDDNGEPLKDEDENILYEDFNELAQNFLNVNPGDDYSKIVYVKNIGTKHAYVRVKLTPKWSLADGKSFPEGFTAATLAPAELIELDLTNWVLIGDYYYYKGILSANNGLTTDLLTGVRFAGANMPNNYQGATFTIDVEAQAIQATNGAINDLWKIDPVEWEVIPATP